MKNKYNSFYFLHIPKTGGSYLKNMVLDSLFKIFKNNNVNFINDEYTHIGWQSLDNNYLVSNFRDPVKRTISHYNFFLKNDKKGSSIKKDNGLIDWVKQYQNFISNYQSKYFMYTKKNLDSQIFSPEVSHGCDSDFLKIILNKNVVLDRISSANILLKDTQLNENICNNVVKKILYDFNINNKIFIDTKKKYDNKVSKNSSEIYKSLKTKEIDYLYSLNSVDSEIYFSDHLYFNNGKIL
jgi:hypothetical protein